MSEQANSSRICPACGAPSTIPESENLWPANWVCGACDETLTIAHGFPLLAPSLDEVDEGFNLDNFRLLAEVEARHFWFRSRNELIRWLIRKYSPGARRALEIGCGTGFALHALRDALPTAAIAGSELHSRGLLTARLRHGSAVELFQMDARHGHLTDALDLIGAFDVLEHIPEDQEVLGQIARMLKPGGILIATVPQHAWMWSRADDIAFHQRRYRPGELAAKARKAGMHTLYTSSFVTLAFPLMMASRILDRLRPQDISLAELCDKEYRISEAANASLLGLCKIEHHLRRAGLPLPFGGSQILVAQRELAPRLSTVDGR